MAGLQVIFHLLVYPYILFLSIMLIVVTFKNPPDFVPSDHTPTFISEQVFAIHPYPAFSNISAGDESPSSPKVVP